MDIIKFLQRDLNLSVEDISSSMGTTVEHINNVINKKEPFSGEDLDAYLKFSGLHFWEFSYKAIPLDHLTEKARDRILLCKRISDHIKKKKKKK